VLQLRFVSSILVLRRYIALEVSLRCLASSLMCRDHRHIDRSKWRPSVPFLNLQRKTTEASRPVPIFCSFSSLWRLCSNQQLWPEGKDIFSTCPPKVSERAGPLPVPHLSQTCHLVSRSSLCKGWSPSVSRPDPSFRSWNRKLWTKVFAALLRKDEDPLLTCDSMSATLSEIQRESVNCFASMKPSQTTVERSSLHQLTSSLPPVVPLEEGISDADLGWHCGSIRTICGSSFLSQQNQSPKPFLLPARRGGKLDGQLECTSAVVVSRPLCQGWQNKARYLRACYFIKYTIPLSSD
jgi:hypothetical protein